MVRVVSVLVLVSGCAPALAAVSAPSEASSNPVLGLTEAPRERAEATGERGARLAPPFGRSAGVRRVTTSNEADATAPAAVASVER